MNTVTAIQRIAIRQRLAEANAGCVPEEQIWDESQLGTRWCCWCSPRRWIGYAIVAKGGQTDTICPDCFKTFIHTHHLEAIA